MSASVDRQLAAVVFLDLVGYSKLMQQNEAGAEEAVQALWAIARPSLKQHDGTEVRIFGDGMLATFPGTLAAVHFCLHVFEGLAALNRDRMEEQRIAARAGVHLGDISKRDGEIFGDGVNIAARLVSLAPPGGVVVSPLVHDQIRNSLDHPVKSLGVKSLKNISDPMEVLCLPGAECTAADLAAAAAAGDSPARRWRFANASFDERARELSVSGHPATLQREVIEVLRNLLLHAGEVVSEQELCDAAGLASAEILAQRIDELRAVLRDSDASQIKLQPGYGYRLAAAVTVEAAPSTQMTRLDFRPGDHPPLRPLWSLEQMLGQGGHGEVWLARHDKTREARVYKFALDPTQLASLKREITLSRVLHDTMHSAHFIRVLDWNLELVPYFIECEYGGSADLLAWAQAQGGIAQVPLATRLELLAQIADALAAAHSVGVLHKDLKPANILLTDRNGDSPSVKLADFGSGSVLDPQHLDEIGITRMGFTRSMVLEDDSGTSQGTALYFAPELLAGQPATVQADVYALGVMLYQMVAEDLRKPLAAGWEADIDDELLREDIAAAANGNPQRRLADAASLAQRLRTVDARRAERAAQEAEKTQAAQALQAAEIARRNLERVNNRRRWLLALTASLVVGLGLALRAQLQARQAAAEAQAVADFMSRDLFSVVGDKPLRDLTVSELLIAAADNLDKREDNLPAVAAQLHTSLGQALLMVEQWGVAERQYDAALEQFAASDGIGSETSLQTAARLFRLVRSRATELPANIQRFRGILASGRQRLGADHPALTDLREQLAMALSQVGEWREAADELTAVIAAREAAGNQRPFDFGTTRTFLGEIMGLLGEFEAAIELQRQSLQELTADTKALPIEAAAAHYHLFHHLLERERFAEAEAELTQASQIVDQWAIPEGSILHVSLQEARGRLLLRKGRVREAIALLESSLASYDRNELVQNRDTTGSNRLWLAQAYQALGRLDVAGTIARDALRRELELQGSQHPIVQRARLTLAEILLQARQHDEARTLLAQLDQETLAKLGAEHPLQGRRLRLSGLLARVAGQPEQAAADLRTALQIFEARYGKQHSITQRARSELASGQAARSPASDL